MMERPRFTAGALRRFFIATGINLLGPFDTKLFADFTTWESLLEAVDAEKVAEWLDTYTAPELIGFLIEDRGGSTASGGGGAAPNKSPAP